MEAIFQAARYTPAEVRKLNYCRLYQQAVTLSNITKPNGQDLDPSLLLTGQPFLHRSPTTRWHTVNQDRPSEKEWMLWRSANRLWSDHTGRLLNPLGAWLHPLPNHRFQFFAYQHQKSFFVRSDDGEYAVYRQSRAHRYRPSSTQSTRA